MLGLLIVLCLILDSRQNEQKEAGKSDEIVLCLILDSRQNNGALRDETVELYCALFWIQGKTYLGYVRQPQGIVLCLILDSRQNIEV